MDWHIRQSWTVSMFDYISRQLSTAFSLTGVITCNGLQCPPNTYTCTIYETSLHSTNSVDTLIQCLDSSGSVLLSNSSSVPITSGQPINSYAEMSIGGSAINCVQCPGDTPADIVRIMQNGIAAAQQTLNDNMANLKQNLENMANNMASMFSGMFPWGRGWRFPYEIYLIFQDEYHEHLFKELHLDRLDHRVQISRRSIQAHVSEHSHVVCVTYATCNVFQACAQYV